MFAQPGQSAIDAAKSQILAQRANHTVGITGGGRVRVKDKIDPTVGFLSDVKIGDAVGPGDAIGVVFCRDQEQAEHTAGRIQAAYEIGTERPAERPVLIKEVIDK